MNRKYYEEEQKMLRQEDVEAIEHEVRLWFEKRGIPLRAYMNLELSDKVLLCGQVCGQTHAEHWQLQDLHDKLSFFQRRGTEKCPQLTGEELEKFFLPLTPSEKLPYLHKF